MYVEVDGERGIGLCSWSGDNKFYRQIYPGLDGGEGGGVYLKIHREYHKFRTK